MTLDLPLRKINAGQQALSFLGPKMWTKVSHSSKNVFRTCWEEINSKQTVGKQVGLNSKQSF